MSNLRSSEAFGWTTKPTQAWKPKMNEDTPVNIWPVFQPSHYDIYCWTHALDEYIPQVYGEIPIEETIALDVARIVPWWMCCENPKRLNKRIKQIILIPVNQQSFSLVLCMRLG